jgi:hypothetical protein
MQADTLSTLLSERPLLEILILNSYLDANLLYN